MPLPTPRFPYASHQLRKCRKPGGGVSEDQKRPSILFPGAEDDPKSFHCAHWERRITRGNLANWPRWEWGDFSTLPPPAGDSNDKMEGSRCICGDGSQHTGGDKNYVVEGWLE